MLNGPPLRKEIRANAEAVAHANGLKIEFIRKKNFRQEDRIRQILKTRYVAQRGVTRPG